MIKYYRIIDEQTNKKTINLKNLSETLNEIDIHVFVFENLLFSFVVPLQKWLAHFLLCRNNIFPELYRIIQKNEVIFLLIKLELEGIFFLDAGSLKITKTVNEMIFLQMILVISCVNVCWAYYLRFG